MVFFVFLLLNAVMIAWPAQLFPMLSGVPLYQILILICLALTFPLVLSQVSTELLTGQPITVCVLGVVLAALLTDLLHAQFLSDTASGINMLKTFIYYLLMISVIDRTTRLQWFMKAFVVIAVGVILVSEAHFFGLISNPSIRLAEEAQGLDKVTGEFLGQRRMYGFGSFTDPNDLCLMLVIATSICISVLGERRALLSRLLWASPMVLFAQALTLTASRGGLLAMALMVSVYFVARFGWKRGSLLLVVALPVAARFLAGRQTDFDIEGGSGQARIQIWSKSFDFFRASPLVGIGTGRLDLMIGHVTHNSFLHAYTELGFVGGACFVTAFYLALRTLQQFGSSRVMIADPELRRLRPCLLALVAGYCAGMMTLSRVYTVPTYLVLGLVSSYLKMTQAAPVLPIQRLDVRRVAAVGAIFLVTMYIFVQYTVQ